MWPLRNLSVTKICRVRPNLVPRRVRLWQNSRSFRARIVTVIVILNLIFIFYLYRSTGSSRVQTLSSIHPTAAATTAAPSVTQNRGTPLLDRLDRFPIGSNVKVTVSRQLEQCQDWAAGVPDVDMKEPQRWQIVDNGVQDTFVFSAFYDSRLGFSSITTKCLCQLSYLQCVICRLFLSQLLR